MDGKMMVQLTTLVRILDFLLAYPFGDSPAARVVTRYGEGVTRLRALVAQQGEGVVTRKVEVARRQELRRRIIRGPLRHLSRVAEALQAAQPQLAAAIGQSVHQMSGELFLATVHSIAATAESSQALLQQEGLSEGTVTDLKALLEAYEAALKEAGAGRRAHTGARAEMQVLGRDLMRMVKQLDGIVQFHYRAQPEVLGAWASARNFAWPVTEVSAPATPARPTLAEGSKA